METTININIAEMKDGIKKAVEIQKFYRNQRKTKHIVGERIMEAEDAAYKHQRNSNKLRIMYAAYGLARGKSFSHTENHYPEDTHPLKEYQYYIDKLLKEYEIHDGE